MMESSGSGPNHEVPQIDNTQREMNAEQPRFNKWEKKKTAEYHRDFYQNEDKGDALEDFRRISEISNSQSIIKPSPKYENQNAGPGQFQHAAGDDNLEAGDIFDSFKHTKFSQPLIPLITDNSDEKSKKEKVRNIDESPQKSQKILQSIQLLVGLLGKNDLEAIYNAVVYRQQEIAGV